ncbi:MAG: hypothetical protein GXP45_03680 [bacterium]|nr:hypothetical protein [bacterium]
MHPQESKLYFEAGKEKDYIAGIMQQEYYEHETMKYLFNLEGDKIG